METKFQSYLFWEFWYVNGTCWLWWNGVQSWYLGISEDRVTALVASKKKTIAKPSWNPFKRNLVATQLKNMLVKLDHFPKVGIKIKNIWNHHLEISSGPNLLPPQKKKTTRRPSCTRRRWPPSQSCIAPHNNVSRRTSPPIKKVRWISSSWFQHVSTHLNSIHQSGTFTFSSQIKGNKFKNESHHGLDLIVCLCVPSLEKWKAGLVRKGQT